MSRPGQVEHRKSRTLAHEKGILGALQRHFVTMRLLATNRLVYVGYGLM